MTSYVTLSIVNNSQKNSAASGLADDAVYLFFTQEKLNLAWSIDPASGVATPMATPGTLAPAFTLADLAAAGGEIQLDASVQVASARLYLSSSPNAVSLSASGNISGPTASTAAFFYDFVELALACTTQGSTPSSAPDVLNVDTTQVDQLGIPLTLQVTPQDPSFSAGSGIVLTLDRQTLVKKFKAMAVGPLAPFADCVFPQGSDASTPYRLLNPSDVIGGQLLASSLQGTLATSGAPGAWQATFTITGPGSPAPTNGGLSVGMPVRGPLIPAGTTVGSLPNAPSGNTVVMTSSASVNPFTASTSPVELFFVTPPATALATYFDSAIDDFFAWCKKNPGVLQVEQNNNGNHIYTGSVVQLGGIVDINGNSNTYTVLQFTTSGDKESYNLYYPFFSTNSAAGKITPFGADVPPPPAWWTPSKGLMYYAPPSLMVFGASGVFADNTQQPLSAPNSSAVLGAIENVIVTALARGYATTWKFLQGGITPGSPATTATVSLNSGVTTAGLAGQMDMASFQIAKIPMTATLPAGAPVSSFSVSSPLDILPTTADLLTFSQFYPGGGTWSAFARFLHDPAVTIDGRAYALPFDDQGGFSSDLNAATSVASPASMLVTMGPWTPGSVKPNVVPVPVGGNSIPLSWQACDDYRFDFVLYYDANGEYVTMDISIISAVSQFSGGGYTLPVALQSLPSAALQETINMQLKPASDPYSGVVWCVIKVPGFDFEGVAFEFSAQYSGAPPETVW